MVGWSTNRNNPRSSPLVPLRFAELSMLAITLNVTPLSVLRATGTTFGTVPPIRYRSVMKRFPYWSNERLASQQAPFSGSSGPVPMTRCIGQVVPPSKLMASNNPAARGAIFVSITMLRGSVGLTATVSSDSLPGRWLTLTFIGVAAATAFTEPPVPAEPTPRRAIPKADTQASPTDPGRIASFPPENPSSPKYTAARYRLRTGRDLALRAAPCAADSRLRASRPAPRRPGRGVWLDERPSGQALLRQAYLYTDRPTVDPPVGAALRLEPRLY